MRTVLGWLSDYSRRYLGYFLDGCRTIPDDASDISRMVAELFSGDFGGSVGWQCLWPGLGAAIEKKNNQMDTERFLADRYYRQLVKY